MKFYKSIVRLFRLPIILSLIAGLLLTACNPSKFKTAAAQVPEMIVTTLSDPGTFNSAIDTAVSPVYGFIYESLINLNPVTVKYEPGLAESWQVSNDGLNFVITLRDGLKWSDGEPMTADDVVFSYNDIYLNPKIPAPMQDLLKIGKSNKFPTVRKINTRQVEFILPEPFAPYLELFGGTTILPKHALEESIRKTDAKGNPLFIETWNTDTDPRKIIGNGPYVMESYVPSQRIVFKRNPYYWRKDAQGNPQPYIERVISSIITSTDNALINFRSGGLDDLTVPPEGFSLLKREEKRGHFQIYNGGSSTDTSFISFNLSKAKDTNGTPLVNPIKSSWFNKKEFRQAVAYGIDRETMKTNVFRGLGDVQNSFVYVKSPYYLRPDKGLKVYNYDPQKAKQLLLQTGFKYNDKNQLLDADGNQVRFTIITNVENNTRVNMAVQIQQDLAKLGMIVDFQAISFNAYINKLTASQNWDCYLGGFSGGSIDPQDASNIWRVTGSSHAFNQSPLPGSRKLIGWQASHWEKQIDDLYIKGAQELDQNKRKEYYYEYQRIASEELPFIHLVVPLNLEAVRDRFANIKYTALGGAFWNIYQIKVID